MTEVPDINHPPTELPPSAALRPGVPTVDLTEGGIVTGRTNSGLTRRIRLSDRAANTPHGFNPNPDGRCYTCNRVEQPDDIHSTGAQLVWLNSQTSARSVPWADLPLPGKLVVGAGALAVAVVLLAVAVALGAVALDLGGVL